MSSSHSCCWLRLSTHADERERPYQPAPPQPGRFDGRSQVPGVSPDCCGGSAAAWRPDVEASSVSRFCTVRGSPSVRALCPHGHSAWLRRSAAEDVSLPLFCAPSVRSSSACNGARRRRPPTWCSWSVRRFAAAACAGVALSRRRPGRTGSGGERVNVQIRVALPHRRRAVAPPVRARGSSGVSGPIHGVCSAPLSVSVGVADRRFRCVVAGPHPRVLRARNAGRVRSGLNGGLCRESCGAGASAPRTRWEPGRSSGPAPDSFHRGGVSPAHATQGCVRSLASQRDSVKLTLLLTVSEVRSMRFPKEPDDPMVHRRRRAYAPHPVRGGSPSVAGRLRRNDLAQRDSPTVP